MEEASAPTHLLLASYRAGPFISGTTHELLQLGQRPTFAAGDTPSLRPHDHWSQPWKWLRPEPLLQPVFADTCNVAGSDDDYEDELAGSSMQVVLPPPLRLLPATILTPLPPCHNTSILFMHGSLFRLAVWPWADRTRSTGSRAAVTCLLLRCTAWFRNCSMHSTASTVRC